MAENRVLFSSSSAVMWAGGLLIGNSTADVLSVDVDSRRCGIGTLFVALAGEQVDGHDFLQAAFGSGACGAVISREWYEGGGSEQFELPAGRFLLAVEDPLLALQRLAASYMEGIKKPVRIGITGSNGKTTTKELVAAVLGEKYRVIKTSGNFNSEIGLPLTVFNIDNSYDYAVIEMGINRVGEMDVLAEILRPDMVVITNIGTAHIGIFKDIQTTAHEKRRAVSFFKEQNTLFVFENEKFFDYLDAGHPGKSLKYGAESFGAEFSDLSFKEAGLRGWRVSFDGVEIDFPLIGRHNLENAFCACALGRYCGLSNEQIKAGLEGAVSLSGRSEIIEGAVTIIQDCYNANADSVERALHFADAVEWTGRKIYVLGDMKELGAESTAMHQRIGMAAAESSADMVFFFGRDSQTSFEAASAACAGHGRPALYHTDDYHELEQMLLNAAAAGDLILIKGSRSMNLERLIEPLGAGFAEGPSC